MPIYEYRCTECHQVFEEWTRHAGDDQVEACPVCNAKAERIISNTSFVLKGGGWYVTDYGFKSKEGSKDAAASSGQSQPPAAGPASGQGAATAAPATSAPAAPAAAPAASSAGSAP